MSCDHCEPGILYYCYKCDYNLYGTIRNKDYFLIRSRIYCFNCVHPNKPPRLLTNSSSNSNLSRNNKSISTPLLTIQEFEITPKNRSGSTNYLTPQLDKILFENLKRRNSLIY